LDFEDSFGEVSILLNNLKGFLNYIFKTNQFKWHNKHQYFCRYAGYISYWIRHHSLELRIIGFASTTELLKIVCPKVHIKIQRGGKVVTLGSFANPTNPTEQFNNFKK
jgi:hypothetical protein